MTIFTGIGKKFMEELPLGLHILDEGSPDDVIKVALYGPNATIAPSFDSYVTAGEVSGGGYTAGGAILTGGLVIVGAAGSSRSAGAQFSNPYMNPLSDLSITAASVAIRGFMVYNSSKNDRNIFCMDLGEIVTPVNYIRFDWALDEVINDGDQLIPMIGQMV